MEPKGNDMTLRVCPMRDAVCPHGMDCPHVDDGYLCKEGWDTPTGPKGNDMAGDAQAEMLAAIDFAINLEDHYDRLEFLHAWRDGSANNGTEWTDWQAVLTRLSRSTSTDAVAVKALEWNEPTRATNGCFTAKTPFGTYSLVNEDGWYVQFEPDSYWEWSGDRVIDTQYTAMAAAQKHLESLISPLVSALACPSLQGGAEPAHPPQAEWDAAINEAHCCDDINLDQPLAGIIADLQKDRERLRAALSRDEEKAALVGALKLARPYIENLIGHSRLNGSSVPELHETAAAIDAALARKLTPATPEYDLGEVVRYVDRQGRPQRGEVVDIEASWTWGDTPLIIYTLSHPSYRNNRCYATIDAIVGRAALAKNVEG